MIPAIEPGGVVLGGVVLSGSTSIVHAIAPAVFEGAATFVPTVVLAAPDWFRQAAGVTMFAVAPDAGRITMSGDNVFGVVTREPDRFSVSNSSGQIDLAAQVGLIAPDTDAVWQVRR